MGKITVKTFIERKKEREKLVLVTAYTYAQAKIAEAAGVDGVLVGDSLGMVIKGDANTLNVSLEELEYHTSCVKKGLTSPLLIADMPFLSYQSSVEKGIESAGRLIKRGAEAVKIEGGEEVAPLIEKLVRHGIPVMGHLGMTPQYIHSFGGYRLQAKSARARRKILEDARILEEAGVFSIVLELIPLEVAKEVTEKVNIPTIGIGAGPFTDGQILVFHDIMGLYPEFKPKFAKVYRDLFTEAVSGLKEFIMEVKEGQFPDEEHSFRLKK